MATTIEQQGKFTVKEGNAGELLLAFEGGLGPS
jgi:hypothetical protein